MKKMMTLQNAIGALLVLTLSSAAAMLTVGCGKDDHSVAGPELSASGHPANTAGTDVGDQQISSAPDFEALVVQGDSSSILNNRAAKNCTTKGKGPYGCTPQCTDWVNCYLSLSNHVGYAYKWWDSAPAGYKQRANGSSKKPEKNDIVVWKASMSGSHGAGHVAVILEVNTDKGYIVVGETNVSGACQYGTRKIKLSKKSGKYYLDSSSVYGWLHR